MNFANVPLPYGLKRNTPGLIVVHSHGEFIDTADRDFDAVAWQRKLHQSAHVFVTPSGVAIRCRNDNQGAYHAKDFNRNSLGIEWLVPGLHTWSTFVQAIATDWVTPAAFTTGVAVIKGWLSEHDIPLIRRHSDISPGRKVDPGNGFPWKALLEAVGVDDNGETHA